MNFILKKVDTNQSLSKLLEWSSVFLAARRGLLMLIGTTLVIISAIVTPIILVIIVSSPDVPNIWLWLLIPGTILHLALLLGFIGFMMAIPLGQSYVIE